MRRTLQFMLCVAVATTTVAAQSAAAPAAHAAPAAPAAVPAAPAAPASAPSPTAAAQPAPVEAGESELRPTGTAPAVTGVAEPAQGFTYHAEGRRDPFVPLLKNPGKSAAAVTPTARLAGLAGLGVADVTVRGVLLSQGAYVAMLHGTDEKTYIVRTGDKLADGTIGAITSQMVVFQQQVNDPLSKVKEREVRKMLRHTDGTN